MSRNVPPRPGEGGRVDLAVLAMAEEPGVYLLDHESIARKAGVARNSYWNSYWK